MAIALFMLRQDRAAVCVAALSVLARPDALAIWCVLIIGITLRKRRVPFRAILFTLAIWIPWILWATAWYGSPLPQSLQAKSYAVYQTLPYENLSQIAFQVGGLLIGGPLGLAAHGITLSVTTPLAIVLAAVAATLGGLWLAGMSYATRIDRSWRIVPAFVLVFLGTYAILGLRGSVMAEWYIVPVMPFIFLGVFSGLVNVVGARRSRFARPIAVVGCGLIALAQVAGLSFGRRSDRGPFVPLSVWVEREALYSDAAAFLRQRLKPNEVVAATEIGALGYACDCVILDTVGLVSPEATKYYPAPATAFVSNMNYAVPPQMIRDLKPSYILSLDVFTRQGVQDADWFQQEYTLIWEAPSQAFGSRAMQLFARAAPGG